MTQIPPRASMCNSYTPWIFSIVDEFKTIEPVIPEKRGNPPELGLQNQVKTVATSFYRHPQ